MIEGLLRLKKQMLGSPLYDAMFEEDADDDLARHLLCAAVRAAGNSFMQLTGKSDPGFKFCSDQIGRGFAIAPDYFECFKNRCGSATLFGASQARELLEGLFVQLNDDDVPLTWSEELYDFLFLGHSDLDCEAFSKNVNETDDEELLGLCQKLLDKAREMWENNSLSDKDSWYSEFGCLNEDPSLPEVDLGLMCLQIRQWGRESKLPECVRTFRTYLVGCLDYLTTDVYMRYGLSVGNHLYRVDGIARFMKAYRPGAYEDADEVYSALKHAEFLMFHDGKEGYALIPWINCEWGEAEYVTEYGWRQLYYLILLMCLDDVACEIEERSK